MGEAQKDISQPSKTVFHALLAPAETDGRRHPLSKMAEKFEVSSTKWKIPKSQNQVLGQANLWSSSQTVSSFMLSTEKVAVSILSNRPSSHGPRSLTQNKTSKSLPYAECTWKFTGPKILKKIVVKHTSIYIGFEF